MALPIKLEYELIGLPSAAKKFITIYDGVTTLVGPNGSGKSQVLRSLKKSIEQAIHGRKVRLLSAGRLWNLEQYRSDFDGYRGTSLLYDSASFGGKEYQNRRHNIETAQGDFHTLSARPDLLIKVAERLRTLFKREIFLEWDAGNLKVNFAGLSSKSTPYSAAREASGLLQLVVLLAALYDDEVGALLIDEPEVSLHPQLQSFLLREMHRIAGDPEIPGKKLLIIATHSVEMIDLRRPEDLANIVFCSDITENPIQIDPKAGELQNKGLRELVLRLGQEHKLTFFCRQPVLLEGPSDVIICTGLDRSLDLYLAAAGAQLVPVIGKGQMSILVKLMRLIGKSPILVADVDAIIDNLDLINVYVNEPSVRKAANEMGYPDASAFARTVYSDFSQLVDSHWDDIAPLASQHPYWNDLDQQLEEHTRKRRAALAILISISESRRNGLPNTSIWEGMYDRLIALLNFLEAAGCFILRRGTIESYYRFADQKIVGGKPKAAIEEVAKFSQKDQAFIEESYSDIIRALRFAASIEPIDEKRALRELLLAVGAAALGSLSEGTSENELSMIARRLIGEKSSLLRLVPSAGEGGVPEIEIHLNSAVLDVSAFPIRLRKGCNPVSEIDRQLGL